MAVTYGFFDSVGGDRVYNADQMSEYFEGLISDGVYESVGDALVVTAGGGMGILVGSGRAILDCKWLKNSTALSLTVTAASATLPRYTAVVVRLDRNARTMSITTKDGTPASTPVKPAMTDNGTVKEICLAYILVGAAVQSITQAVIQDMRGSGLCSWVTGLIQQIDTSTLFLQWQDAFETYYNTMRAQFDAWFADLTDELRVDTYVEEYRKTTDLSSSGPSYVVMDMAGYVYAATDTIMVWINGLIGQEDVDYTITQASGSYRVSLSSPLQQVTGATIDILVLKSKIGFSMA